MYPFVAPKARTEDLVISHSDEEVLVYDKKVHHIHHLNNVSHAVWNLCNGRRPLAELRQLAEQQLGVQFDEDALRIALTKLHDIHLLSGPLPQELHLRRTSRRGFNKRTIAGATAIIVSISAPSAAAAASNLRGQGEHCMNHSDCSSGYCDGDGIPWGGICIGN
jgi:hypothetical protein